MYQSGHGRVHHGVHGGCFHLLASAHLPPIHLHQNEGHDIDELQSDGELCAAVADPNTPQAMLADLAYDHEELRPIIASNPSSYEGLLGWLRQLDEPDIHEVLAMRARGTSDGRQDNILRVARSPADLPVPESGTVFLVVPTAEQRPPALSAPLVAAPKTGWRTVLTKPFVLGLSCLVAVVLV